MDALSEFDKRLNALLKEFEDSISREDMIECLEFYVENPRKEINNFTLVDDTFSEEEKEKYAIQRAERGFDDTELWNLNTTICQFIIPRLEEFKKQTFAYPPNITFEEWISIIDKMLDFFKRYCDDDIDVDARKDEGFKLFCEYFEFLWW